MQVYNHEEEEDLEFNDDDFGSRLQDPNGGEDEYDDEDPFDAIFEEDDIIKR